MLGRCEVRLATWRQLKPELARRLDVQAAVERDLLSIRDGQHADVLALSQALPYAKWVYHAIDYI